MVDLLEDFGCTPFQRRILLATQHHCSLNRDSCKVGISQSNLLSCLESFLPDAAAARVGRQFNTFLKSSHDQFFLGDGLYDIVLLPMWMETMGVA
eukprot:7789467-Karenia_brevis.AAC.1